MIMKKQKGFTLVELMVVMAIIAILSTAGISQYGRFIKKARDSTRMEDLNAINVVLIDAIQKTWLVPPDTQTLEQYIRQVAGKEISDPLGNTATACLDAGEKSIHCGYYYVACDGGTGYILGTSFESTGNIDKYNNDNVSGSSLDENKYEIGTCETPNDGTSSLTNDHLLRSSKNISGEV